MLNGKVVFITGGTGSFGNCFVDQVLARYRPERLIVYSRDEFKQFQMRSRLAKYDGVMRYVIGDVRDADRLSRAMRGADYVVHAAALKQVPACEYNPEEAVRTNIHGAMHVIEAALDAGVKRVAALSTDKAVNPVSLYGGTKLVSDKLFIAANAGGPGGTRFSVVRYGNVAGSRGSVIPRFRALAASAGGETFVAKLPSFKVTDLAEAVLPGCAKREVGLREGEKLHEVMITREDAPHTLEYQGHFVIYPRLSWWTPERVLPGGRPVPRDFVYSSGTNESRLTVEELRQRLRSVPEC